MVVKLKLTKKQMINLAKKICKSYDVATDLLDWESVIDESLSWKENKAVILNYIKSLSNSTKKEEEMFNEAEKEFFEQQMNLQEQEYTIKQFEKAIEEIKNTSTSLDKYFKHIKELVKITAKGNNNGLILISNGGLGKTFTVLSTLNELGLKLNQDFVYLNSYITSLELYHILYNNKDKIIFFDDVEKILDDLTKISLLKACLWESAKNMRIVSYYSSTEKLKAPLTFEFKGKIILALNKIPEKNKEIVQSLLSRAIVYKINFSYQDMIKIFYELAKILKIDLEVVDFIKENTDESVENLNFRTLIQASVIYDYYKKYPDELNGQAWKSIVKDILIKQTNDEKKLVLELMKSNKTVKEQIEEFIEKTGLSRRTFFRIKKAILTNSQVDWG